MLKALRKKRKNIRIKDGTFLKQYIWTSVLGVK
jgi:hypothetical protein